MAKLTLRESDFGYKSGDRYYGGLPAEPEYDGMPKRARYYKELHQYFKDTVSEYPEYDVIGTSPTAITLRTPDGKETIDLTKFDALADADEAIEMASHYFDESLFEARKKKKNGALVNPDAGNVEHNIEMFNKMNSPVEGPSNNPVSGPFGGDICAESLDEARDPYFTPYGYRDAAKVLNGKAPEYYYHLKEIEMDQGDGEKLAKYARKLGLPVVQDPDDDPDYPTFYILGKYHWNDYFYPYPSNWEPSIDNVIEENMNYNIQFYQIFRSPTSPTENGKMVAQAGSEEEAHIKGKELCGAGNYLIKAVCDDGKVRYLECANESFTQEDELNTSLEYGEISQEQFDIAKSINFDINSEDIVLFIQNCPIDLKLVSAVTYGDNCGDFDGCYKVTTHDNETKYFGWYDRDASASLTPVTEAVNKQTVELEYVDLSFTQCGPKRDVDDWDEYDRCVDWTYTVDKDDVITFLYEDCITEQDVSNWYEMSDEEAEAWVIEHFDELFEKYRSNILEHWEEDAAEDAAEKYDSDDYVDWDSMPGGHDDDRYWEDLEEDEEVFMEKYSYGLREEYKREPKMIDYFEQMNSEEDEA